MPESEKQLVNTIREKISTEVVLVEDQSDGCGTKFSLIVVSTQFEGLTPLERHRKVNESIKDLMPNIHALSLKTWTPTQYQTNLKKEMLFKRRI